MNALDAAATWLRAQPPWLAGTLLVAASLVAAWLVATLGVSLLRRLVGRTENRIDDLLFREVRVPASVTVAVAGAYAAATWLDVTPGTAWVVRSAVLSVLVVVWARATVRIGDGVIEYVDEDSEVAGFAPIFENLLTFVALVGASFVLLALWRVDVTPLLASAGIAGIAVGFAAKDTVANFFGSIALYVDDTYTVGDYVVLDSGEAGTVVDISIRSTRLLTKDDVLVTVPNSALNAARITNQSAPGARKRVKLPVGVAYGTDVDHVEEVLLGVAAAEELVVDAPAPRVRFRRFGDSALEFELLCWVGAPLHEGRAVHRLNRAVYGAFQRDGVEIPFPQQVVTVRERP